jgi:hypothetical protein
MYYLLIMACDPYLNTQPTERQMEDALQKRSKLLTSTPILSTSEPIFIKTFKKDIEERKA